MRRATSRELNGTNGSNLTISKIGILGLKDPELFATYKELASETRDVFKAYIDHLIEQLTHIISDGVAQGEFATDDPLVCAQAVFNATTHFHDPAHVAEWSSPDIDAAFDGVWSLLLVGLRPRNIS